MPPTASPERNDMLALIVKQILDLGGTRLRVGIDGFTAAGKTSFGHEIAERISHTDRPVFRASLDDFKKPWRDRHLYDRESGERYYRNAFDDKAIRELLLEPAVTHGSGKCALCSIDPITQVDHSSEIVQLPADAILIVDGLFAFRRELNHHWDYRIWLDIDDELSVRRGTERDSARKGSNAEQLHQDRYLVAERIYLAEANPVKIVQAVIDNTMFDQPHILRLA